MVEGNLKFGRTNSTPHPALVAPVVTRNIPASQKIRVLETNENLPQLYRFCFLMTGEAAKAQQAFQNTLRAGVERAAKGEAAPDRLWFFRDARWQSLIASESGLQAEPGTVE